MSRLEGGGPFDSCAIHGALRYEIGKMLLEQGELREAERYLESVEIHSGLAPAKLYLGQIYEASGDLQAARREYADFVRWWQDCDPELKPLWEEGRRTLERLKGVERL